MALLGQLQIQQGRQEKVGRGGGETAAVKKLERGNEETGSLRDN